MTSPSLMKPRTALTKFEYATLILEQQGYCGCGCGQKLVLAPRMTRDEHLGQRSITGDDSLKNRSIWRPECTKPKDKKDAFERKKLRSLTKATKKSRKPKKKIYSNPKIARRKPYVSNVKVID